MRPTTKLLLDMTFKLLETARGEYRRQVATGTAETIRWARERMVDAQKDLERVQHEANREDF